MNKNRFTTHSLLIIFVGLSGCFSVLFGAWLAHGGQLLSLHEQTSLSTALQYQFIHTIALYITLVWALKLKKIDKLEPSMILTISALAFFVGILLFSGGIYLKTLFNIAIIGKFTPFGGISLALAWLLLVFQGKKI
jgi:uncharacterized membrane protein YgdD (TMEM256/DUF423 family)